MSLFDWFKRKKPSKSYDFDDEDRQHSIQIRRIDAEKKRLVREIEITRLKKDLYDLKADMIDDDDFDDEENPDSESAVLMMLLTNILNKQQSQSATVTPTTPPNAKVILTSEQIEQLLHDNKKVVKIAKNMSDDQLKQFAASRYPEIANQSVDQIIQAIRQY